MGAFLTSTLSAEELLLGWIPRRVGRRVVTLGECASTNDVALGAAENAPADGLAVFADHQSAGRGRQGRSWVSPRAASILCSVVVEQGTGIREQGTENKCGSRIAECGMKRGDRVFHSAFRVPHSALTSLVPAACLPVSPEQEMSGRLTLLAAVAACEAIQQATEIVPSIKWPNDLRVPAPAGGWRKLAGVLIESRLVPGRSVRAWVIGIGINCLQQAGHFPPELRDRVTSLEIESSDPVARPEVARALLQRLDAWLADPPDRPDILHDRWLHYAEPLGESVRLISAGREYHGRILAVDPAGGLVVQTDAGGRAWFEPMRTRIIS
jgi:BirA family biotin operon repressor/biotin-[acetyl-CoA-carboxylase] ligase